MNELLITSHAFENGDRIPDRYTGKGEDISPPLEIRGVDPDAKSLAIIVDDPDVPIPFFAFTHWIVYNIPVSINEINENVPHGEIISSLGGAMQGRNTFGKTAYMGPNPPFGTHTYRFKVYSLDTMLDLKPRARKKQLVAAMKGHILQYAVLEGRYGKKD